MVVILKFKRRFFDIMSSVMQHVILQELKVKLDSNFEYIEGVSFYNLNYRECSIYELT